MPLHDLSVAAARFSLGLLPSSEIPRIANDALEHGIYSFELAEAALNKNPVMSEVEPMFEAEGLLVMRMQLPKSQSRWTSAEGRTYAPSQLIHERWEKSAS